MTEQQRRSTERFDDRRTSNPHPDPHAAYGPDRLARDTGHQNSPLAAGAHGRALGSRREQFNPYGVWAAMAAMLLAGAGIGLGIILDSWWLIGICCVLGLTGAATAWAFGILNDTR